MKNGIMKNILLAISGLTPQIVTETLFVLAVKNRLPVDEIYIVTTMRGKDVIEGKDKGHTTPDVPLKREIQKLCKEFGIKTPKFSVLKNVIVAEEESNELYDIKTDKENKLFPNKLAELLKKLTAQPDVVIHASLSGGRKSMSAHLALVMSLFARAQDKLYHIVTDEKFEFKNFYPKTREEENALILAEIPFVRLRCLNDPMLKANESYSALVDKTQKRLNFLMENEALIIDLNEYTVRYKDRFVVLTPIHISLYYFFVKRKKDLGQGIAKHELINLEFAEKVHGFLVENLGVNLLANKSKQQIKMHWATKGFDESYFNTAKSKINSNISTLFENKDVAGEFIISKKGRHGSPVYYIKAPKDKLKIINYE